MGWLCRLIAEMFGDHSSTSYPLLELGTPCYWCCQDFSKPMVTDLFLAVLNGCDPELLRAMLILDKLILLSYSD